MGWGFRGNGSAIGGRETCKQIVLQHERCHDRGINVWWAIGRARFILPGASVGEGQTSRRQENIPGRGNSMCAGMKAYKEEKCGMPKCPNITHSDCERELRAGVSIQLPVQACLPAPAPSSLHLLCAKRCARCCPRMWTRSRSPGKGEGLCDQLQTQDLSGWCCSGSEGKAAGKCCQRRIMGELGVLQILSVPGHKDFQTVGKGGCVCVCVGSFCSFCTCSWASGDLICLALVLALGGLPGKPLASSRDVVRGEANG